MYKSKVLVGLVLLCYVLYVFFEFSDMETVAFYFYSAIVPLITTLYILFVKQKSLLFLLFLLTYSLSDIMGIVIENMPYDESQKLYDFDYYVGNSLYMVAYMFLIIEVVKTLNPVTILKKYKVHVLVLIALKVYLIYVLHSIINPRLILKNDYYLELIYNIIVLSLLSLALLNFLNKDNKKSFYLFLGALLIVFSEIIDIAYIYIAQRCMLNFLGTTLALGAFYFFYEQSRLLNANDADQKFMIFE